MASTIIVATAREMGSRELMIYHVGSSDRNPLTWKEMKNIVVSYWNNTVSHSRMGKANVLVT